jgi:hypothetical protein
MDSSFNMRDDVLLDIELDQNELQDFLRMAVSTRVRQMLLTATIKLYERLANCNNKSLYSEGLKPKKSYLEVATSNTTNMRNPEALQRIPMHITSQNFQLKTAKLNYRLQRSDNYTYCARPNITANEIINRNKTKQQKENRKILLIGDSDIKGFIVNLKFTFMCVPRAFKLFFVSERVSWYWYPAPRI